ncbi:unnamed protein product [Arabidopsis lyrata]|uniref:uncharacterized protein At1g28695-like isoform X1 n=1 Tax=Arabidopsis lyrata subsp. lyrata TaxID=81972 RepID=UPI000A29D32C|nr:uncharacterized protein At1g28695-like isoform X1 [Arabidopsis lyrata subsp. lyrata]XP_020869631.1 uncharacterized protein At1g28695-like isoform X1 [Arabidopsis lyrata subsp. lyrata]XP_020869632.1 uncharacterized protein At1g28695-like isoform X1 [Arabidopsis lyrata subsp. lyrata]XP_020869633.1 uncharacterized protein At1g28695-like isoform X1 [Arabidopsis lyrata subsp. lyrata]XP_020869634.1 uncharacterized protein At1g28695-like isoform X1 [Arabidopsis lyrata subsp. lyrata]XP_020869635.1 |eukprot:XP_020869630.1 uncharacterized protein At1g28695-like isoform X1 [Arabidopsis lyrata subsp. lyrata]
MPSYNNSSGSLALAVSLLFAGALYICFSSRSASDPISDGLHNVDTRWTEYPVDELEAVLDQAATGNNKTVIITMVNKAYVDEVGGGRTMMDLFLESFWEGEGTRPLLNHLMVVAADQTAYDRCLFRRLHCYKMDTQGVDLEGEKVYMSKDFIEMMWRRTRLLLDVLSRGYNLIFTDTDVMWLRSPFSRLSNNESLDMQISVDSIGVGGHLINTGFYHVRSNNKTISLFQKWYDMRLKSTGMKEQDVLKQLLDSGFFDQLGLNVGFLNTTEFSGFCQDSPDMGVVTTVHANCCRYIPAKISDLTLVLHDWKHYKASRVNSKWSPHVECRRSWSEAHYIPKIPKL